MQMMHFVVVKFIGQLDQYLYVCMHDFLNLTRVIFLKVNVVCAILKYSFVRQGA